MKEFLKELSKSHIIGAVGGSDLVKIKEQLQDSIDIFNYVFSENGLVGFKDNQKFHEKRIADYLGEEKLQKLINYCLRYIANLEIPVKRGTFIEYRTGLINVSPIGRNCSTEERKAFHEFNKETQILEKFRETVEREFADFNLKISIGGQISFDIFPIGWDKTYCLQFLNDFENIFFFGDKTSPGGNDYEIANHDGVTIAITVTGPEDTIEKVDNIIKNVLA